MRNRAKCKLCNDIIESVHHHDYISCKCGEIAVDGGQHYCRCSAKSWENFIRVDDEGNEIIPKIVEKSSVEEENKIVNEWAKSETLNTPEMRKILALDALEEMIKKIEELPQAAMITSITHYDYYSLLLLLSALFRANDCKEES